MRFTSARSRGRLAESPGTSPSAIGLLARQVVTESPAGDVRTSVWLLWIEQSVAMDRSVTQGMDRLRIGAELCKDVAKALDRGVLSVANRVGDQALDINLRQILLQNPQDL